MERYIHGYLCLVFCHFGYILCGAQNNEVYTRNSNFDGLTCDDPGHMFTAVAVRSSTECARLCSERSCSSFFYARTTLECSLCDRLYSRLIGLPGAIDTKCYQKMALGSSNTCLDLLLSDYKTSGVYELYTPATNTPVQVYCDMEADGGGWIVWQRRFDGSEDFNVSFTDYEYGFGNASGEYWLGLALLQEFLANENYSVYLEFTDFSDIVAYQMYDTMELSPAPLYTLYLGPFVSGNDSMLASAVNNTSFLANNFEPFSTFDDNQGTGAWCPFNYFSGWWFNGDCTRINPNGLYSQTAAIGAEYMINEDWREKIALKATKLMIREN